MWEIVSHNIILINKNEIKHLEFKYSDFKMVLLTIPHNIED
jgi:hypothetical protein